MTSTNRTVLIIGILAILALAVFVLMPYMESKQDETRTGTERLDAADVVDLEVQAEQEFKANGGEY